VFYNSWSGVDGERWAGMDAVFAGLCDKLCSSDARAQRNDWTVRTEGFKESSVCENVEKQNQGTIDEVKKRKEKVNKAHITVVQDHPRKKNFFLRTMNHGHVVFHKKISNILKTT
jgi:hypothetical protein